MPLFRRQRAMLDESLATTIIVKNMEELRHAIWVDWHEWLGHPEAAHCNFKNFHVKVEAPFNLSIEDTFDPRCGWYTHYVSADLMCEGEFHIVGFLSEPLQ